MGLNLLAWAALSYFVGSIPTHLVVTRFVGQSSTRRLAAASLMSFMVDCLKGAAVVWLATQYAWSVYAVPAAGVAVVVGECFPFWGRQRDRAGLAAALGALAVAVPLALLAGVLIWGLVLGLLRRPRIATLAAASVTPLASALLRYPPAAGLLALGVGFVVFVCAASQLGDPRNFRQ